MGEKPMPAMSNMNRALRDNIETLSARAREDAANAPTSQRIADQITAFAGSMTFVLVHVVLFGLWIAANTIGIPGVPHFDDSLVILAMAASVEAIFLSTFVLISQNRMAAAANRSADLDLHISLLTEHELTRLAMLIERIAHHLEVSTDDLELAEIEADVAPSEVLDALEERRVQDGQQP
jgi:uncharacterized membrane protein